MSIPERGYGHGGYGAWTYGHAAAPEITSLHATPSERLGENRMLSIEWVAGHGDGLLDRVEVVANDGAFGIDFSVAHASGASASGWELYQFPVETTLTVTARVTATDGQTTTEQATVTLDA